MDSLTAAVCLPPLDKPPRAARRPSARSRGRNPTVSQDVQLGTTRELEEQQWQLPVHAGAHR